MKHVIILCWFDNPTESIELVYNEMKNQNVICQCIGSIEHSDNFTSKILEYLSNNEVDLVIVWNRSIYCNILNLLKTKYPSLLIYLFNWDDPHSVYQNEIQPSMPYFDHVFSCCKSVENDYIIGGSKKFTYLPPCVGRYHFPEEDENFKCDVNLVCTNFYTQFGNIRKKLAEDLRDSFLNFHLYGPENIKLDFPNNYKGFVNYNENHKIFYNSKLSISTHVANGNGYLNERDLCILASGGILLTDKIDGMEDVLSDEQGPCYIVLQENYMNQIHNILQNYHLYQNLRVRGRKLVLEKYNVSKWCNKILS
jgi:hypothetical protein